MHRVGLPLRIAALGALALLGGRALALDGAAACQALALRTCPEPLDATQPEARDMLTWDVDARVVGFRNNWRMYRGDVFHAAGTPSSLPRAAEPLPALRYATGGRSRDLDDYLEHQRVTGLLLDQGRTRCLRVLRPWQHGSDPLDVPFGREVGGLRPRRHRDCRRQNPLGRGSDHPLPSGTAPQRVGRRHAAPADDPHVWHAVERELRGPCVGLREADLLRGGPGSVSLRHAPCARTATTRGRQAGRGLVLQHGRRVARRQGPRARDRHDDRALPRDPPVAARADGTRRRLACTGTWPHRHGGHGFNATLRDWGRFALFVERGGRLSNGRRLLPKDWVRRSTTWTKARGSVTADAPDGQYGYQWWYSGLRPEVGDPDGALTVARQSFWAEGIYGQAIAIDPAEHVVMVQWSTWPVAAPGSEMDEEQLLFFAAAVHALHR